MSMKDWLHLNVGGRLLLTTRSSLTSVPDSVLARMFSTDAALPPAYCQDGVYYLDCNPDHFSAVLDYLRYGKLFMPQDDTYREAVANLADYFGIQKICELLRARAEYRRGTWKDKEVISSLNAEEKRHFFKGVPLCQFPRENVGYLSKREEAGSDTVDLVTHEQFMGDPEKTYLSISGTVCPTKKVKVLHVDLEPSEHFAWVETTRGTLPPASLQVGQGQQAFIGRTHRVNQADEYGWVDTEGVYRQLQGRIYSLPINFDVLATTRVSNDL